MNRAPVLASSMVAELCVAPDHAAFAGHFPGRPILPGATLLDTALHEIIRGRNLDVTRWQLQTVKFLDIVRPGDVLILEHSAPNLATIRFTVRNPGRAVASGTLTCLASAPPDPDGA